MQTSRENLFRLLNILDESEFGDAGVFEDQCEANTPVVQAATAVRRNPPDTKVAVESLKALARNPLTRALTDSAYFINLLSRCRQAGTLDRDALVELQRDINELSLTGKIMSRTRKADVVPDRTIRDAHTLRFRYSPLERAFYDSVAELCEVVRPDLSGWGQAMAALMAFRATASCIPAAAKRFREQLSVGRSFFHRMAEEFDEDREAEVAQALRGLNDRIEEKLHNVATTLQRLTEDDTKYEDFRTRLRSLWVGDGSSTKVVVFSFFKPTLRYLYDRLAADEITCRLISGDIGIPDRRGADRRICQRPGHPCTALV